MKQLHLRAMVAALLSLGLLAIPHYVSASGQNSCLSNEACVSDYFAGSLTYGFAGNQSSYWGIYVTDGNMVNDNVGYGRDRNSTYPYVCYYLAQGYTGGVAGSVPYYGATWVAINRNASSHFFHQVNDC